MMKGALVGGWIKNNSEMLDHMSLTLISGKFEAIKLQLRSLLGLRAKDILASCAFYHRFLLLNLEDSSVSKEKHIRNIEVLLLDDAATELLHPTATEVTPSFESLAVVKQYDPISQLLHIQNPRGIKDETLRN